MAARGTPLPEYVQREFKDYLKCGLYFPKTHITLNQAANRS